MEKLLFTNNATTTLSGTLSIGGTTLVCSAGEGAEFPAPGAGEAFFMTLYEKDLSGNETRIEIVKCTGRTADTFTIERDAEGIVGVSGGYSYPSAPLETVYIELRWTAACAQNMHQLSSTHAAASKTTPVDADEIALQDSATSFTLKSLTWANLKATIKAYYDSVTATLTNKTIAYASNTLTGVQASLVSGTNIKTVNGASLLGSGDVAISGMPALTVVSGTTQAASAGNHYALSNASASTVTLPASPAAGDVVVITVGNGRTDNVIDRNGNEINGEAENMTIDAAYGSVWLRYIDGTLQWRTW